MVIIYKTKYFTVEAPKKPHVDRKDGGQLIIRPKKEVVDRSDLSRDQAVELMKLTMVFGKAMMTGLRKQGIPIARINYQDNGNWALKKGKKGHLHMHLYGRAKNSVNQKHGEALYFPPKWDKFYAKNKPLNPMDIKSIMSEAKKLFASKKYQNWY